MRLKDKVAIVTGAAGGIGLACAEAFVKEGAKVMLSDVDAAKGEASAKKLGAKFTACDVGDAKQVQALVDATVKAFGRLDVCVSNAGIIHTAEFLDISEADFDRVIRVNAIGPGTIGTDLARAAVLGSEDSRRRVMGRTPLGRLGDVEEVATVALFLASDDSSYITGQTIYPDGGRLALNYTVPVK
jgi:NAD(P)-dependent dehydrogenase (short-subunit alcohol dehydrogenase family)